MQVPRDGVHEPTLEVAARSVSGGSGSGAAPGTPGYNPAWYAQAAIDWDPGNSTGNAKDTNSGIHNSGAPLLTWAEIVRRYGATDPEFAYGTGVIVYQLSAQPSPTTDPVWFAPKLSGGGQAVLLGSLIVVAGSFDCGAVTAKVRGGPGVLLQAAGMPGSAAARQIVWNQTRNSYATIDVMTGAVATMSQPVPASAVNTVGAPTLSEDNSWATGDTLVLYNAPACNLKLWRPQGGDRAAGGASTGACAGWVQFVRIVDTSGTGASEYPHSSDSAVNVLSMCQVDPRLHVSLLDGRGQGCYVIGCDVTGLCSFVSGTPEMYAGIARGGISASGASGMVLDGDIIVHTSMTITCYALTGSVYSDASLGLLVQGGGGTYRIFGGGAFWGSAFVTVNWGAILYNTGQDWTTTLLTSGALYFNHGGSEQKTTGSYYTDGSPGVWTGPVTLTAANLQTRTSLLDPVTASAYVQ